MSYPSFEEYTDALRLPPAAVFLDPVLGAGSVRRNAAGVPFARSGNFALTYEVSVNGARYAVRCFHKESDSLERRYEAIARKLKSIASPWFMDFDFQPAGIRTESGQFPIVRMQWAEGCSLAQFISEHRDQPDTLLQLRETLCELARHLQEHDIAHGDIQPGNIIVKSATDLKLIDYDGMFVPELEPWGSAELGQRNFQHPGRSWLHYDERLDRFSFALLDVALEALAMHPALWELTGSDEAGIVLRASDFADPATSTAFGVLAELDGIAVRARQLAVVCRSPFERVPALDDFLAGRRIPASSTLTLSSASGVTKPAYIPAYAVLNATNFARCCAHIGDRIELIGRIRRAVRDASIDPEHASLHVEFGDAREDMVRLVIWPDSGGSRFDDLAVLEPGRWVSAIGLVDPILTETNDDQPYKSVCIAITEPSQLRLLTEVEALRRLAANDGPSRSDQDISVTIGTDPAIPAVYSRPVPPAASATLATDAHATPTVVLPQVHTPPPPGDPASGLVAPVPEPVTSAAVVTTAVVTAPAVPPPVTPPVVTTPVLTKPVVSPPPFVAATTAPIPDASAPRAPLASRPAAAPPSATADNAPATVPLAHAASTVSVTRAASPHAQSSTVVPSARRPRSGGDQSPSWPGPGLSRLRWPAFRAPAIRWSRFRLPAIRWPVMRWPARSAPAFTSASLHRMLVTFASRWSSLCRSVAARASARFENPLPRLRAAMSNVALPAGIAARLRTVHPAWWLAAVLLAVVLVQNWIIVRRPETGRVFPAETRTAAPSEAIAPPPAKEIAVRANVPPSNASAAAVSATPVVGKRGLTVAQGPRLLAFEDLRLARRPIATIAGPLDIVTRPGPPAVSMVTVSGKGLDPSRGESIVLAHRSVFSDREVIVGFSDCASATSACERKEPFWLLLRKSAPPVLKRSPGVRANQTAGTVTAAASGVHVDLGLWDGVRQTATLTSLDDVYLTRVVEPSRPLAGAECRAVAAALESCAASRECGSYEEIVRTIPPARMQTLQRLFHETTGLNAATFRTVCVRSCELGLTPTSGMVRREVCAGSAPQQWSEVTLIPESD